MCHLCCVFLFEFQLTETKCLVSPGELVSEMFVGRCFGSEDDLCLPLPLTLFFPCSSNWSQKYPSMHRRYLPVCLCQPKIRVTGLLSSDASVSLTNTLNEHVCAWNEIWTFYTRRVGGFMHLCVWLRGVGLEVSMTNSNFSCYSPVNSDLSTIVGSTCLSWCVLLSYVQAFLQPSIKDNFTWLV